MQRMFDRSKRAKPGGSEIGKCEMLYLWIHFSCLLSNDTSSLLPSGGAVIHLSSGCGDEIDMIYVKGKWGRSLKRQNCIASIWSFSRLSLLSWQQSRVMFTFRRSWNRQTTKHRSFSGLSKAPANMLIMLWWCQQQCIMLWWCQQQCIMLWWCQQQCRNLTIVPVLHFWKAQKRRLFHLKFRDRSKTLCPRFRKNLNNERFLAPHMGWGVRTQQTIASVSQWNDVRDTDHLPT